MSTSEADRSNQDSTGKWLVVAVVAMLVTMAGLLLVKPGGSYSITAYLNVHMIVGRDGVARAGLEIASRGEVQRLKSRAILMQAVGNWTAATGDVGRDEAAAMLRLSRRLHVDAPGEGSVIELRMSGRGADSEGDLELMRCVIDAYLEDFAKQHTQVAEVGLKTTPAVKVIQPPTLIRRSAFGF